MMAGRSPWFRNTVASGFDRGLFLHVLQVPLVLVGAVIGITWTSEWQSAYTGLSPFRVLAIAGWGLMSVLWIGVTQVVYLAPAAIWAWSKGYPRMAGGLLLTGAVTLLVNMLGWTACGGPPLPR
jgi:hypothetical protein